MSRADMLFIAHMSGKIIGWSLPALLASMLIPVFSLLGLRSVVPLSIVLTVGWFGMLNGPETSIIQIVFLSVLATILSTVGWTMRRVIRGR